MNKKASERYRNEINGILFIIDKLKNGRYYEKSGAKIDGYLETNLANLENDFYELLNKIDNDLPSKSELLRQELNEHGLH